MICLKSSLRNTPNQSFYLEMGKLLKGDYKIVSTWLENLFMKPKKISTVAY